MLTNRSTTRDPRDFTRNIRQLATNRVRARRWQKGLVEIGTLKLCRWVPTEDRQTTRLGPLDSSLSSDSSSLASLAFRRRSLRQLEKQLGEGIEGFDSSLLDSPPPTSS